MAANFEKTFEFKVKGRELNRALDKIFKNVDKIEATVEQINGDFATTEKEINKVNKATINWTKNIRKAASDTNKLSNGILKLLKSFGVGTGGGGLWGFTKLTGELGVFDAGLRKLTGRGLPYFTKRIQEATTALGAFGLAHAGALSAVVTGGIVLSKGTQLFYNLGKAARQAEASLIDFWKVAKKSGPAAGIGQFFPKGSHLGGLGGGVPFKGEQSAKAVNDALKADAAAQLTGQSSSINLRNMRSLTRALENQRKIQENISAFTWKHVQGTVKIRQAQTAYNHELLRTKVTQAALTADIWAAKKAWSGLIGVVKGASGLLGGLLGGKAGKLGQAAGVVGISRGIEAISQQLNRLNIHWLDNASSAASWVRKVTEGVAAVTIAYTGLEKLMGAASWTIGAVAGFKKWESQAALSIRNINRQAQNLYTSFSALLWMMQGKGGTPGGVGSLLNQMRMGGEERIEEHRFADQGPTRQQDLQKRLDFQTKKLQQRNITEKDYLSILKEQIRLKDRIGKLDDRRLAKEVEAGRAASRVFKDEYDAFRSQVDKKRKAAKQAANDITRLEKQETAQRNKLQADAAKNYERLELNKEKRAKQRHRESLKRERELAAAAKRRMQERRDRRGRMMENLMIGAGCPLLVGGGPGAGVGGVGGAGIQAATGSQGFGAQILLSAIGQQVDAFVTKTAELGKAFNSVEPDVDALVEAMGLSGTETKKLISEYQKVAGEQKALEMASREMSKVIGQDGVDNLRIFGEAAAEWGRSFSQAMLRVQAAIAGFINRTGLAKTDGGLRGKVRTALRGEGAFAGDPEITRLREEMERLKGSGRRRGRQAAQASIERIRAIEEEAAARIKIKEALDKEDKKQEIINERYKGKIKDLDKEIASLNQIMQLGSKEAGIQSEIAQKIEEIRGKEGSISDIQREQIENKVRLKAHIEEMTQLYTQVGSAIKSGMVDAIEGAINGSKNLNDVLQSTLRMLQRIFIEQAVISSLKGTGFSIFQNLHTGGVAQKGKPHIVGEKGPELFIPNKTGTVVANDKLIGGGGGSTVVNVAVDASGSSVEGKQAEGQILGEAIGVAIQKELIRQRLPGGLLY